MKPRITILGEHPFAKHAGGKLRSRIGTAFPWSRTLVTLPGIHATQRQAYLDFLNQQRQTEGLAPLSSQEGTLEWNSAVDLIIDDGVILIRPDPDNMPLAFQADEMLLELVPKYRIKFLGVLNEKVREAIKRRGECWRISPLPKSPEEMRQMIPASRMGLHAKEIYYYSRPTGIHYLTWQQFAELRGLDDAELREQLVEIQKLASQVNSRGQPEIAFFAADPSFTKNDFAGHDFCTLDSDQLSAVFETLRDKFFAAVPPELHRDDLNDAEWRNRMVAALIGQSDQTLSEEALLALSPEFFMQIEWLPGGRIEDGELILDSILEETGGDGDEELKRLRDEKPQKFIFNFVREYGDLEHVNVGRVIGSLSRRPALYGRRDVYIAVVKQRDVDKEIVSIIRMQKWGVREHLDLGRQLIEAMIRSEEYTEYILDRRLGCRQLGMNLPLRVAAKKIAERYVPHHGDGFMIWSPHFERDYIRGMATDKLPLYRFENQDFAVGCARLLGRAAAPNIVVGRCDQGGNPLFDDGDEVLIEDAQGMPADIVVADHTGTFNDYLSPLQNSAAEYAVPVNRRIERVPNPGEFAEAYVEAFVGRFARIQDDYRRRKKAFDTLFKYRPRNEAGSFAYRWERVLARLDGTDPRELARLIRQRLAIP
jgi:hypothetical protein